MASMAVFMQDREYVLHRQRLQRAESQILKSSSSSSSASQLPRTLSQLNTHRIALRESKIARENEELHRRLRQMQESASALRRDRDEHLERFTGSQNTLARNKEPAKISRTDALLYENVQLYRRLEGATSVYPADRALRWYHEQIRPMPRSDRTRLRDSNVPRELLPAPLPKISPSDADSTMVRSSCCDSDASMHTRSSLSIGSRTKRSVANSSLASSLSADYSLGDDDDGLPYISRMPNQILPPVKTSRRNRKKSVAVYADAFVPPESRAKTPSSADEGGRRSQRRRSRATTPASIPDDNNIDNIGYGDGDAAEVGSGVAESLVREEDEEALIGGMSIASLYKVVGWEFPVPQDTRNCVVNVYALRDALDEHLFISVVTSSPPYRKLSELRISIDEVYDVVECARSLSQMAEEDSSSLRMLLQSIFIDADNDKSGLLSFAELQALLEKINLGLSTSDLRCIVAEADVDDSGLIDYEEFVPIAVDMIMAYRARAQAVVHQIDSVVMEAVKSSISVEEIQQITDFCISKFRLSDPQQTGVISYNLFKSRLMKATACGLTPNDIRLVCQSIPRDYRGRCLYGTFKDVLFDTRFMAANNAVIEAQGSGLQKLLIEMCLAEEARLATLTASESDETVDGALKGTIPLRNMVDILLGLPQLSLSRVQVMLLTSDANVVGGRVGIYQFVPACVKTIEMMFDPEALQVRADLLAKEDLSVEALLDGENEECFHRRIGVLFTASDTDGSGGLDLEEFSSYLKSINLGFSSGEMLSLYNIASATGGDHLSLEEFSTFISKILLDLVRERKIQEIEKPEMIRRKSIINPIQRRETFCSILRPLYTNELSQNAIGFEDVSKALKSPDIELCDDLKDIMLSYMVPIEGATETLDTILEEHSRLYYAFSEGKYDSKNAEVLDKVDNLIKQELFVANSGICFESLEVQLKGIEDQSSNLTAERRHAYLLALKDSKMTRLEANYVLQRLFPLERPAEWISVSPTSDKLREIWKKSSRLSVIGDCIDSRPSSEISSIVIQHLEMHFKNSARHFKTLRQLIEALLTINSIQLSLREILHLLFIFDGFESGMIIAKTNRLAKTVVEFILLRRSNLFFDVCGRLLDYLKPIQSNMLRGLSKESLLLHIDKELALKGLADVNDISEKVLLKILPDIPYVVLGEREIAVVVATLSINAAGKFSRKHLEDHLFDSISRVRWARIFARRYVIFPTDQFATKSSADGCKQAMRRLTERLLNAIKLENLCGMVRVTFPNLSARLLRADTHDIELAEEGEIHNGSRKSSEKNIKVEGHQPRSLIANVTCKLEINLKKLSDASFLEVHVCTAEGLNLSLMLPGVPSLAVIDDDCAEDFIESILQGLYIWCDVNDIGVPSYELRTRVFRD